jgi:hypothetical protein
MLFPLCMRYGVGNSPRSGAVTIDTESFWQSTHNSSVSAVALMRIGLGSHFVSAVEIQRLHLWFRVRV